MKGKGRGRWMKRKGRRVDERGERRVDEGTWREDG